jgi:hypothetical protein
MKHKNYGLIILGLLFSFNVSADVLKEAQNFLIAINDYQGFWFYSAGKAITPVQEEAFLKEWQRQASQSLCTVLEHKRALFKKINQQTQFLNHHVLLLFTETLNSQREQTIRDFAHQYQLPLIVAAKQPGQFSLTLDGMETPVSLHNVFTRLNANFQDVFLLNPQKRQITLLNRSHHPCLLEQDFFFELYKNIKDQEKKS